MSLAAILAALKANADTILAIWLVVEQLLAANKNIKANSTFQLILNAVTALIKKNAAK
jgi:hypothetical protein